MAQTVSNDAIWEKMSEIEKKIDGALTMQKSLPATSEQSDNNPDLTGIKDEIIADIRTRVTILGKHSDVNFEANRNNLILVNKNVTSVLNVVNYIREQQRKSAETQQSLIESKRETTSNYRRLPPVCRETSLPKRSKGKPKPLSPAARITSISAFSRLPLQ